MGVSTCFRYVSVLIHLAFFSAIMRMYRYPAAAPRQPVSNRKGSLMNTTSLTLRETGMIYTPLTKKALFVCCVAHSRQVDKSGVPYMLHPFHIAERMTTEYEVCTALLHDVVEDTNLTMDYLRAEGFPEEVLEAVLLLTRDLSVPYLDYIRALKHNDLARKVKLADLIHNSTVERLNDPERIRHLRLDDYHEAIRILQDEN